MSRILVATSVCSPGLHGWVPVLSRGGAPDRCPGTRPTPVRGTVVRRVLAAILPETAPRRSARVTGDAAPHVPKRPWQQRRRIDDEPRPAEQAGLPEPPDRDQQEERHDDA